MYYISKRPHEVTQQNDNLVLKEIQLFLLAFKFSRRHYQKKIAFSKVKDNRKTTLSTKMIEGCFS